MSKLETLSQDSRIFLLIGLMLGGGDALQLSLIATLLCSAASIATNATVSPTFIFVLGTADRSYDE